MKAVFPPDILVKRQGGLSCILITIQQPVQPAFNDLFNGFVMEDPVISGPFNRFDQPFPSYLLFHGENTQTAAVGLLGIAFLV